MIPSRNLEMSSRVGLCTGSDGVLGFVDTHVDSRSRVFQMISTDITRCTPFVKSADQITRR